MKMEDIIALSNAGFTKNDIMAMCGQNQNQQIPVGLQLVHQTVGGGLVQKIVEALVQHQQCADFPAPRGDPQEQFPGSGAAGGIVGLAEKDQVHTGDNAMQKALIQRKSVFRGQAVALRHTVHRLERGLVLRKSRSR